MYASMYKLLQRLEVKVTARQLKRNNNIREIFTQTGNHRVALNLKRYIDWQESN